MYRSIPHTADIAYEIEFSDYGELFKDVIDIIRENCDFKVLGEEKEFEYNITGEVEDDLFDIGNEMIYEVERGWVPKEVIFDGKSVKIRYEKSEVRGFDLKALTYHMTSVKDRGGRKVIRVVFDV